MPLQFSSALGSYNDNNNNNNNQNPQVQMQMTVSNPYPTNTEQMVEDKLRKIEQVDIVAEKQQMRQTLANSAEIDSIVSTLDVSNQESIITFGGEVADEISRCSDAILRSVNMDQIDDSGQMLMQLKVIMDKFDAKELSEEEQRGIFKKMFANARKQIDQILSKYHSMGDEVDKVYVKLKQYESEIIDSNRKLEQIFTTNVSYYQQLVKYIIAGEEGITQIDSYIADLERKSQTDPDNQMLRLDIDNLNQARVMLEQRVQDLRIAENVAMQTVPMLKAMQFSNLNLVRKINSAFIITLPVFKQALAQAVLLKRQKIQAEAMQALDEKTNEMLLKNAQNTALQTKLTAQLTSTSSIKVETLEKTWSTIVQGIEETRRIQDDARIKRQADTQTLNRLKEEFVAQQKRGSIATSAYDNKTMLPPGQQQYGTVKNPYGNNPPYHNGQ